MFKNNQNTLEYIIELTAVHLVSAVTWRPNDSKCNWKVIWEGWVGVSVTHKINGKVEGCDDMALLNEPEGDHEPATVHYFKVVGYAAEC